MAAPAQRFHVGLALALVLALACVALLTQYGGAHTELVGGDSSVPGSRLLAEALRDDSPHPKGSRRASALAARHAAKKNVAHPRLNAVLNRDTDKMAQHAADEVTKLEMQAMDSIKNAGQPKAAAAKQPSVTKQPVVQVPVVHVPKESKAQLEAEQEVREEKKARRVVLELAREHLSENFDRLRLARDRRKHDGMVAQYEPFLRGKFGKLMAKKSALVSRERLDITAAKALEARARRLSQQVVKNLNVHNGKFSLAEWYRNGGALESSKDSTVAVAGAKRMWARVVTDQRALKRMEASPLFNKHATQLAAAEIVLQNSNQRLGADAARITTDGERVARLSEERRMLSNFLPAPRAAPAATPVLHHAAPHNAGTAVADAAKAVADVAVPVHAVMTAAGVASGGGAQSKGIADSVGSIASSIARAVGLGGLAHAAGGAAAHAAAATPPATEAVAAPAPQAVAAPTLEGTIRPTMFVAPPDVSGARPLMFFFRGA